MKDFFPESLGHKCGCALYMGAHYTQQNTVYHMLYVFICMCIYVYK